MILFQKRNIMSNSFICNCRLNWLREWLKNSNLATGNPKCSYPESLKDRSIASTTQADCVCSEQDEDQECSSSMTIIRQQKKEMSLSENRCPKMCTCLNDIVRCSHLKIEHIPLDIPITAKEL